ncbi:uncharacterized protein BDR25DRAFT_344186 [Lindgomyces ingoldianus]|uniref:Uncharacterized protein n=1 Tax=Lindgomyces ingoldianus TaxID=673940 RepID=A0ACB6QNA7_9PLEO|nr:uncharacterized protein BDR25DRAFT_344186 [Lindgomyces ingoldianus]KAF2468438.1 hypothetical protein BDR25DRAFT_344186 [Lindgomyces ingoldianus]
MAVHGVNVWAQMDYVPPRGQCNFKPSIMSAKCPCLRFMLHPLKSASSYECDGCSHHASFHSMENKAEDEVRKRWENEAREKEERENGLAERPRKRLREIEYQPANGLGHGANLGGEEELEKMLSRSTWTASGKSKTRKGNGPKLTRGTATRSRAKVVEMPDDDYIEVD